ncbi:MAG TPA: AAA family ATPase [Anaerolineae bacterium]|nr:AAA family ATPase [Anaerolineae bacterium]
MAERLVIRDFGPIRSADLELRNLTVFVGPQATGKSLAAQVLFFLNSIGDFLDVIPPDIQGAPQMALEAMAWWFGNKPSTYASSGSLLRWEPTPGDESTAVEIRWNGDGVELSPALIERLHTQRRQLRSSLPLERIYMPGGRTLYSFLPSYTRAFSRAARDWPGYVQNFYEILGYVIRYLSSTHLTSSGRQMSLPILDWPVEFCNKRIETILKGQLRYARDSVGLDIGRRRILSAMTIASGQMEIWPFWAVLEALFDSPLSDYRICIEEPEAHLHPRAQRTVMEIIASLANVNLRFLLTTHSPYIVYAVNNFLLAQEVLRTGQPLPEKTVPPQAVLNPNMVSSYRFGEDGHVHDILDSTLGLIDEDELDSIADELGASFTALQEALML